VSLSVTVLPVTTDGNIDVLGAVQMRAMCQNVGVLAKYQTLGMFE